MTNSIANLVFFGMIIGAILFTIKKLMSVLQLIGSAQTIA